MRQEIIGFWEAVVPARPYADNLHLAPDRKPHQQLITQLFTGWMFFLTPNCVKAKALKIIALKCPH